MAYHVEAVPQEVRNLYTQYGGAAYLDGSYRVDNAGHTVFGQVFDGMDVVDAIAAVSVDADDKPIEDVTIESARDRGIRGIDRLNWGGEGSPRPFRGQAIVLIRMQA